MLLKSSAASNELFSSAETLLRTQSQTAQVAQVLVTPQLLFAFAVEGQLFAKSRRDPQKPDNQSVRKIFNPFHTSHH